MPIKTMKSAAAAKQLNNAQINKNLEQQFQLLQQTLGNQKVQELVKSGALPTNMGAAKAPELQKADQTRQEQEAAQIEKDREALMPEILKKAELQKDKLRELKNANPGKPIYANVETELKYVDIPGQQSLSLYHLTELKKVSLSLSNINEEKSVYSTSPRVKSVPVTFSFLYDENKVEEQDAEEPEESAEEKQAKEEAEDVKKEKE